VTRIIIVVSITHYYLILNCYLTTNSLCLLTFHPYHWISDLHSHQYTPWPGDNCLGNILRTTK